MDDEFEKSKKSNEVFTPGLKGIKKYPKSYDNAEWIHSRSGRHIRIMCEYMEVQDRLRRAGVLCTMLICGSARCMRRAEWQYHYDRAVKALSESETVESRQELTATLARLKRMEWLCEYWDKTHTLCYKLMKWFQTAEAHKAVAKILSDIPSPARIQEATPFVRDIDVEYAKDTSKISPVALCTGGGPGMMEAANKGARDAGARSMGMGISLPYEHGINQYVDPDLAFQFHYFFTRKFWMLYTAVGLIATPGGMGTMDELLEVLTLKQCGKFKRDIPVVLFGKDFWKSVCNFDKLAEYGTISPTDLEQFYFTDDPDDAFEYIRQHILADKLILGDSHVHKSIKEATRKV